MIFVTVGTAQQPFNRLIKAVDDFASQTDEAVIIQAGTTTYLPLHAEYFRWTSFYNMEKLTRESRIVITQASAGAIIMASKFGRPLIVVPRLSKYGENFNDHQYQLALALQANGQAFVLVENLSVIGLQEAIDCAYHRDEMHSNPENLVKGLNYQLNTWQKQLVYKKNR